MLRHVYLLPFDKVHTAHEATENWSHCDASVSVILVGVRHFESSLQSPAAGRSIG